MTALAVNPLIGLGAFVTQWLLKHPLASAMTMEYAVTGTWDDPKIDPLDGSGKPVPSRRRVRRTRRCVAWKSSSSIEAAWAAPPLRRRGSRCRR